MDCLVLNVVAVIILLLENTVMASLASGSSVDDENKYETEIDSRESRSFEKFRWNTLSVRPDVFTELICWSNGVEKHHQYPLHNYEYFAIDYRYSTRKQNCSCPQTPIGLAAACDWVSFRV